MSVTVHPSTPLPAGRPLERKWLVGALVVLVAVYLSMLNRYWVPSGDGDVYVCIARSLVQMNKLFFNGAKAAIAPPGWPLVLSWLMRISPEFLFLKVAIIASMVGGFASAFFILRRFVSDRAAAGMIVLTGTLSSIYPLTYWTHSEAFFCLLGFAAILLAFRISEGRARLWWEVPAMLVLLGLAAFTRWPGLLHLVLVIPILLSGAKRAPWRRSSTFAYIGLVLIASFGTFFITYEYLKLTKAEQKQAVQQGGVADSETDVDVNTATPAGESASTTAPTTASTDAVPPGQNDVFGSGKRSALGEIYFRFSSAGRWFAWLLWQPTRFGQSVRMIDNSGLAFGWLAIVLLIITTIRSAQRHDFFWIGLAIYTGGLCMLWPNPTARYFVPVAPFIVLGIYRGIGDASRCFIEWKREAQEQRIKHELLTGKFAPPTIAYASPDAPVVEISSPSTSPNSWLKPFRALWYIFVAATLLINLPLLAIDIYVFRSNDFYGKYEAAANKDLLEIAQFIRENPQPEGTAVAVHEFYDNMGRQRYSKFGVRALHLLLDESIIPVERQNKLLKLKPNDDTLRKWLRRPDQNAYYCITQDSWTPWRVWHFRLTPTLQEWLTKRPVPNSTGGWELWTRESTRFVNEDVPERFHAPTRVPGL